MSKLNSDDIIFDHSHQVLTEADEMVLVGGLNFCLPPKVEGYVMFVSIAFL